MPDKTAMSDEDKAQIAKPTFNEFGFVEGYVCPHCGGSVKENHTDDIGTTFYRCEKCCQQSARLRSVEKEKLLEPARQALALLKDSKLLFRIKEDIDKTIKGEDENKLLVLLLALSARTKDYTFFDVVGESAVGKTNLVQKALKYVPSEWWRKVGRITPTAIDYLKDQNFHLLWIQEARGAKEVAPTIRLQSLDDGGLTVWVTERNKQTGRFSTNEYFVPGRGVVSTTTNVSFSAEDATRTWIISADPSEQLTKQVVDFKAQQAMEPPELLEALGKKPNDLAPTVQQALEILDWEIGVVIPYASDLTALFSMKLVRTRRDIDKFFGLIKVLARLFQFQRPILEVNSKHFVVATAQDALIAFKLGAMPLEETLTGLEKRLREIYQAVIELTKENSPVTNTSVGVKIKKSSDHARKCLRTLVEIGYLDLDESQKVHTYSLREKNPDDNRQIQKQQFSAVELQKKVISYLTWITAQHTAVEIKDQEGWKNGYFDPLNGNWTDLETASPPAVRCAIENSRDATDVSKIKAVVTLEPAYQGLCMFCGQHRTLTFQVQYFSGDFANTCTDCGTPLLEKVKAQSG